MPKLNAQQVVLQLIRAADGEWCGKKRLFKAFYFAHLYYAAEHPGILTDWPIARLPEGPGINDSSFVFDPLVAQGLLVIERVHVGPYPEYRYRLTEKALALPEPPDDAKRAIEQAAQFSLHRQASELSAITHEHSRSWKKGQNGDTLDIYIDLIPDDEYETEQQKTADLNGMMIEALEDART